MSVQHTFELFRAHREVRGAFLLSLEVTFFLLGWLSLGFADLNPYLILISFPMFDAILIFIIIISLLRAENENMTRLRTIPKGIRKTLTGYVIVAVVFVVVLNVLFEIIAIVFREFLIDTLNQGLSPIEYTPDPITLISFLLCSASLYGIFVGFPIWIYSESKVIPSRNDEELAKLERFVSLKFIILFALMILGMMLPCFTVLAVINPTQWPIEPALVAFMSTAFNIALSSLLWHSGLKALE